MSINSCPVSIPKTAPIPILLPTSPGLRDGISSRRRRRRCKLVKRKTIGGPVVGTKRVRTHSRCSGMRSIHLPACAPRRLHGDDDDGGGRGRGRSGSGAWPSQPPRLCGLIAPSIKNSQISRARGAGVPAAIAL